MAGHFHGSIFVTVHALQFLESVSCVIPDMYNAQASLFRLPPEFLFFDGH